MVRVLTVLALAAALAGLQLGDGGSVAAVQSCDASYPTVCLPPGLSISCFDIGFPLVVVYDPSHGATDPYHLDPDFDGIGCEGF